MVRLSLLLQENTNTISAKIRKQILKDINTTMDKVSIRVIGPIRNLVRQAILDQPEALSLSGGTLAGEFGLPDGRNRIEDIVNQWVSNIIVSKKRATASGRLFNASFTIKMIRADYKDVLQSVSASVVTDKGSQLDWLEWLLLFGDRTIVRGYDVSFQSNRRSRSGIAIMVGGIGKNWGVPPEFSGTINNNFVTRAIDGIEDDIIKIFEKQLRLLT